MFNFLEITSDPFETQNMEISLTPQERSFLHDTLEHMKGCRGKNCILPRKNHQQESEDSPNNINSIPFRGSKRRHGKDHLIVFRKINLKFISLKETLPQTIMTHNSLRRFQRSVRTSKFDLCYRQYT